MSDQILLGIDMGGTHTDAALIAIKQGKPTLIAKAKVPTNHMNLPASLLHVLHTLEEKTANPKIWLHIDHVTLGTTLAINALVQNKTDPVGLILTAGPGLAPTRFALGNNVAVVKGGLDHRGVEVSKLQLTKLDEKLLTWRNQGIKNIACVGKFSPRNPEHENKIGALCQEYGFSVSYGHRL
ncbi:MAG: hydantoinase/oxoprolinase family protein, partial [Desulfovibrio sp.]|nr:hydantoinase/oxoprolinase family protein [Desulfovibrio sp.]